MKYYYLYQITCWINLKTYIGAHETYDLDDGYMGSGSDLTRDQNLLGIENFSKVILGYFDTHDEMMNGETKLVDKAFVDREDTYNLNLGGHGGWCGSSEVAKRGAETKRLNGIPFNTREKALKAWETRRKNDPDNKAGLKTIETCRRNGKMGGGTKEGALKGIETKRKNGTCVGGGGTSESALKAVETKRKNGIPLNTSESALKAVETKRKNGIPLGGTRESLLKGWETRRKKNETPKSIQNN